MEVAKERIKGPVTLLSLSLINQSDKGIVLIQLLGAVPVQMQEREGLVVEEEPASQPVLCSGLQSY